MLNSQNKIALLFHRIVKDEIYENKLFEDVSLNIFNKILLYLEISEKNFSSKNKYNYVFTFDDGHESDYSTVFPRLIEKNFETIFFIVPNLIGTKNYLNWDMVLEMSNHNMKIGSHSMSHKNMRLLNENKLFEELFQSKNLIEQKIGKEVVDFSYPYGYFNKYTNKQAIKSGYTNIFTSNHGVINNNSSLNPRNSIHSKSTFIGIKKILEASDQTRIKWKIEDYVKSNLKLFLNDKLYKKIRNLIL